MAGGHALYVRTRGGRRVGRAVGEVPQLNKSLPECCGLSTYLPVYFHMRDTDQRVYLSTHRVTFVKTWQGLHNEKGMQGNAGFPSLRLRLQPERDPEQHCVTLPKWTPITYRTPSSSIQISQAQSTQAATTRRDSTSPPSTLCVTRLATSTPPFPNPSPLSFFPTAQLPPAKPHPSPPSRLRLGPIAQSPNATPLPHGTCSNRDSLPVRELCGGPDALTQSPAPMRSSLRDHRLKRTAVLKQRGYRHAPGVGHRRVGACR